MTTYETFTRSPRRTLVERLAAAMTVTLLAAEARIRVWKNRRQVAELLGYDDRMLRDIGLTSGDVMGALSTRADEDASLHLSMLHAERRYGSKAQARDRLIHAAELNVTAHQRPRKSSS